MNTTTRLLMLVPLLVVGAACGSDSDSSGDASTVAEDVASDTTAVDDATNDDDATESDGATNDDAATNDDDAIEPPPGGDGGEATLTLANGEIFEFADVLCSLEPQVAAGSEILFTAVSYGDPGLDITQFGDEGTITGVASISVYNSDYDTLWDASSIYGSAVELTLDGSTIRGTGSFLPGPDLEGEPVEGEIVANC